MDKEYQELEDLEFEYNLTCAFINNEDAQEEALKKLRYQINRIRELEESISNEGVEKESDIETQEE